MNRKNVREMVFALSGAGDPPARIAVLSQLVVDLLVEVEALREAVIRLHPVDGGAPVHGGYDFPCDESLTEDKAAYPASYADAAFALHNAAGPSSGLEKLLGRFYPSNGATPRESLMLRRLGYSDAGIARFVAAMEGATEYS